MLRKLMNKFLHSSTHSLSQKRHSSSTQKYKRRSSSDYKYSRRKGSSSGYKHRHSNQGHGYYKNRKHSSS